MPRRVKLIGTCWILYSQAMPAAVHWFTTDRVSVLIAGLALLGIFYSWRSARSARESATAARSQATSAENQVELGRQQIELLLKQLSQADEAQRATQQAQQESLQPMIIVDLVSAPNDRSVLMLVVENIGPSIGRDVRIQVSPPPTRSIDRQGEKPMHDWHIFTHGIPTMPPKHRLEFFFDIGFRRFEPGLPTQFTFTVDAVGPFGATPKMTYEIDLNTLRDAWVGQATIGKIVKQLEKMTKNIAGVADAVRQLDPEVNKSRKASIAAAIAELEDEPKDSENN